MGYKYEWPTYPDVDPRACILDKRRATNTYIRYMLARTQSMFRYNGLPDTIPQRMLELYLQTNGTCCIAEHEGSLYAFTGSMGGEPDPYYQPTLYVVANPALKLSKEYTIDKDCILVRNDSLMIGLIPMFGRFTSQIAETDVSMWRASINSRAMSMVGGSTDAVKKAADKFFKDLEAGEFGAVADQQFIESLRTYPINGSSGNGYITQLIELRQYWSGLWWQELGLNAAFNMKREVLNEAEAGANDDTLLPLVDDMLKERQEAMDKVNRMFGTSIQVELNSSWENIQIREDLSLEPEQDPEQVPEQDPDKKDGEDDDPDEGE